MLQTLYYENEQIGDFITRFTPDGVALTPAVTADAVFFPLAPAIFGESVNFLYQIEFFVQVKRATMTDAVLAALDIQAISNKAGDFQMKEGNHVALRMNGWTIMRVSQPDILEGHGGRWIKEIGILIAGNKRPFKS